MIMKEEYLRDLCKMAAIPDWKAVSTVVPKNMKIQYENIILWDIVESYTEDYVRWLPGKQSGQIPRQTVDGSEWIGRDDGKKVTLLGM